MPIFRTGTKLVLYAHVPKCGGSAVSWYLSERFGALAFHDNRFTRHEPRSVWSRTSPQHIDRVSLDRLFPAGFFDACFTIVRHPVDRLVSAYHFQLEVERCIPDTTRFTDWLEDLPERRAENPFSFDNHVRPMDEIVPEGAMVFHMEHGLDALVPWFDALTGDQAGPRAFPRINERGNYTAVRVERTRPSDWDIDRIATLYARDFARFGYAPDQKMPASAAPTLTATQLAERDTELRRFNSPTARLRRKLRRKLGV